MRDLDLILKVRKKMKKWGICWSLMINRKEEKTLLRKDIVKAALFGVSHSKMRNLLRE